MAENVINEKGQFADLPAIFFDIDGTLRDVRTGNVPESAAEAVRKLRDTGYFLGIATGRCMLEVEDNIRDLTDWDAYVCTNGQEIYLKGEGKIYEVLVPDAVVHECLAIAERTGTPVQLVAAGGMPYLTREPSRAIRDAYAVFGISVPEVRRYKGELIISVMVFGENENAFGEYERIDGIGVFPGSGKDTTGDVYADIALDGVSKYSGIKHVLERLGTKEYIAFGDSCNDLEMLRHAKLSVAMGDAHRTVTAAATHSTCTVADGGIAAACRALGLYADAKGRTFL